MHSIQRTVAATFVVVAIVVATSGACGSPSKPSPAPKPPTAGPAAGDLFDLDRLLRVELTIEPAAWDVLRREHHDPEAVFGSGCLDGPAKRPYNYAPATLVLDGAEPIAVEVRKKGFLGSVSAERPSLKVRFKDRVRGVSRLTLNNNQQDPSQVHQCIAYRAFERFGVAAPRCSLAHVTVNGTSLGIYSNVESMKKPFLRRVFGDVDVDLYEGNISDFRTGWLATFQHKSGPSKTPRDVLAAVAAALERPDDEVEAALAEVLDVDAFLTFWAAERLIGQWDGYTNNQNNFYMARPVGGRLQLIPWGADSVLGDPDMLSRYDAPASVYATSALPHRLYRIESFRRRYVARLDKLLAAWDADAMLADVKTLEALAKPHLHVSETAFEGGLTKVRAFITKRPQVIAADVKDGPVAWKAPLRSSPCSVTGGAVDATFETTWMTEAPANPLAVGKVEMSIELGGRAREFTARGTTASAPPEAQRKPTIGLYGLKAPMLTMIFVSINPEQFAPGKTLPIDGQTVTGIVLTLDLAKGSFKMAGFLGEGTIELSAAKTTRDAPVVGRLKSTIVHPGYWNDPLPK